MQKHINNKYFRVQDAFGDTFVMVPERDFIQHTKVIQEQKVDIQKLRKELEWKTKQLTSAVESYEKLNTNYYLDINKTRIRQRQEDAKIYSWWKKEAGKYKALYRDLNKQVYFEGKDAESKWEKKYKTLVSAIDAPVNILQNICNGHVYEEIHIKYPEDKNFSPPNAF